MEIPEFPDLLGFLFIFACAICKTTEGYNKSCTAGMVFRTHLKCQERGLELKPRFADNPSLAQLRDSSSSL